MSNSHLDRLRFFFGLRPQEANFDALQNNVYSAFQRLHRSWVAQGVAKTEPVLTLGASYAVTIGANAAINNDGVSADWGADVSFDPRTATHGAFTGDTTPSGSRKRYIILAVAEKTTEGTPTISPVDGNSYNYTKDSDVELRVYATAADYALADDWTAQAAVSALLAEAVADGATPLVVCERRDGTTTFASSDVHALQTTLYPTGSHASELHHLRETMARGFLAFIMNDSGQAAGTGVGVPATPGRIDVTGGEVIAIGVPSLGADGLYRKLQLRRVTIPATSLTLGALSTAYVVRIRVNPDTGAPEVYVGTGDYPNDTWPGPFVTGSPGGSNQGFPRTAYDIPLFQVVTASSNGVAPTVTSITNLTGAPRNTDQLTLNWDQTSFWGTGASNEYTTPNAFNAFLAELLADLKVRDSLQVGGSYGSSSQDGLIQLAKYTGGAGLKVDGFLADQNLIHVLAGQDFGPAGAGAIHIYHSCEASGENRTFIVHNAEWTGSQWSQIDATARSQALILGESLTLVTVDAGTADWDLDDWAAEARGGVVVQNAVVRIIDDGGAGVLQAPSLALPSGSSSPLVITDPIEVQGDIDAGTHDVTAQNTAKAFAKISFVGGAGSGTVDAGYGISGVARDGNTLECRLSPGPTSGAKVVVVASPFVNLEQQPIYNGVNGDDILITFEDAAGVLVNLGTTSVEFTIIAFEAN